MNVKIYVHENVQFAEFLSEVENCDVRKVKTHELTSLKGERFSIFVLPYTMEGINALDFVKELREVNEDAQVFILSEREWDLDTTLKCISLGVKGIFRTQGEEEEIKEALRGAINTLSWMLKTEERLRRLREENEKIKMRLKKMKESGGERSSGSI